MRRTIVITKIKEEEAEVAMTAGGSIRALNPGTCGWPSDHDGLSHSDGDRHATLQTRLPTALRAMLTTTNVGQRSSRQRQRKLIKARESIVR